MVMPDWFIKLLESLKLRQTEEEKAQMKIAEIEEELRKLKSESAQRIKEIDKLESECKNLKAEYDVRQGAARQEYAMLLQDALGRLKDFEKLQNVAGKHLKINQSLLLGCKILLDGIQHPARFEEIGMTADEVKDMLASLEDDLKESASLEVQGINAEEHARNMQNAYDRYFNNVPTATATEVPPQAVPAEAVAAAPSEDMINEMFDSYFAKNEPAEKDENKLEVN